MLALAECEPFWTESLPIFYLLALIQRTEQKLQWRVPTVPR